MNEDEVIHWVREVAGRGDAEAAMKLGESYMKGEGEALEWFHKAAELKSKGTASPETPSAPGSHVVPPMKRGRRKLRVAAAVVVMMPVMGIGASYVAYQRLIKEGKESEAMERLHIAAEDGSVSARADPGLCYANGRGVSGDMTEAVKWYRRAAGQGHASAKKHLKRHGITM